MYVYMTYIYMYVYAPLVIITYMWLYASLYVCRDPGQLLSTSNTLLLKVVTLQVGDEGSGSDDATSVTSDGDLGPR